MAHQDKLGILGGQSPCCQTNREVGENNYLLPLLSFFDAHSYNCNLLGYHSFTSTTTCLWLLLGWKYAVIQKQPFWPSKCMHLTVGPAATDLLQMEKWIDHASLQLASFMVCGQTRTWLSFVYYFFVSINNSQIFISRCKTMSPIDFQQYRAHHQTHFVMGHLRRYRWWCFDGD